MAWLVCALALAQAAPETYHWPLDLPRELTSSFGEHRPARFHAGIDLRTGGVIGKAVYSAASGHVSRVRCSPWGYGKAIYVQHEDGITAVYGHLDDYYPELRAYVRQAQHRARNYVVDLHPEAGQFPVARGQFIAKSGQTGIGAPHLHYELRDGQQRPINPRLLGITWPDDVRPQINGVLIQPRGPCDSVNGDMVPVTLAVRSTGAGQYATDPVTASGAIGFGVSHVDPGSGGRYKLGAWRLSARADGQSIFVVQSDRYAYDEQNAGAVAWHPFRREHGRYQLLWRWPGNTHGFYTHTAEAGWFTVPDAGVDVVIEVTDFHDNTSTVTVPVRPETPAQHGDAAPGTGAGTVSAEVSGDWLTVTARFSSAEGEAPEGLVEGPADLHGLAWRRVGSRTYRAGFAPPLTGKYTLRVLHPRIETPYVKPFAAFLRGRGATVNFGEVTIAASDRSAFGVLFVAPETLGRAGSVGNELKGLGSVYRFWPADAPIDAPVTVSIPLPEGGATRGVHAYRDQGSSWGRRSTEISRGRASFTTGSLGDFALYADATAPAITNMLPAQGAVLATRRPEIRATATDNGSGIARWEMSCGGMWLLSGYDPDHNRIYWVADQDLPPGPQEIRIRVTDEAGNTAEATRSVTAPQP